MSFAVQVETGEGVSSPVASGLYGICGTLPGTPEKAAGYGTLEKFDTLIPGVTIHVKFTYGNTATNPTLSVNGTEAKPIIAYDTVAPGKTQATSWKPNSMVSLTYDGTYWRMNDVGANAAIIELLEGEVSSEASARATAVTGAVTQIAAAYDNTATYALGALCIHEDALYVCITPITTAEDWTAGHWAPTTVKAQIGTTIKATNVTAGAPPTATAAVSGTGITGATVNAETFATQISASDDYVFSYDGADWKLNNTPVLLATYGITVTPEDGAVSGDKITVTFAIAQGQFILQTPAVYAAYPYRATLKIPGVTSAMIPNVTFGVDQAISGIFAPIAETDVGQIYIYASEVPGEAFTIPTIICWG